MGVRVFGVTVFYRQAKKTTRQLNTLNVLKLEKKAGHFSEWNKPDFDYLDSIPCRSKSKQASRDAPKETADERARLGKQSHEWISANKVGSLDISLDVQALQIRSLTKFRDQQALKICR
jgi:hypothetical protein